MHVEFLEHWSGHLNRQMPFNRYGYAGMPIVVFPSSGGSHNEYADFGMIDAAREYIDQGKVQFFTLSSMDSESWLSTDRNAYYKALTHDAYDRYVIHEAVPAIKHLAHWNGPMMTTGCSMGAFHAVNFLLQHPDVFQGTIALSGIYDVEMFVGDAKHDPVVYLNSPADYLWDLNDPWFLDRIREAQIIICTGHGAWEQDGLPSFYHLRDAFAAKQLPAWFDEWGTDVAHDWNWWRIQLPYFLGHLFH